MKGLSKSRYTAFCQCPKNLWLKVYKPDEAQIDDAMMARFAEGNKVGDLAMGLFGDYIEAKAKKPDGSLDLVAMVEQTQKYMKEGVENICEASFILDNHYCAVDILRRNGDGWDIYEVKSSTYKGDEHDTEKELLVYSRDIAYQKWLLTQCGVKVNGCYLVRLNKFYTRGKELDIQQLFHIKNMDELVENEYAKVPANVNVALKTLASGEPNEPVAEHCQKPYCCAFFDYCTKGIPTPNVFDLYRMNFKKKCELYNQGKVSFEDLRYEKLSEIQHLQVNTHLNDTELVTPQEIREFLKKLTYPLYFLDFETMMPAVPEYEGTRPYQQITFQYSLHWIEEEGGRLEHTDFLGNSVDDPRRALAEKLCLDIPKGVCSTAYNKGFECGRLKELAEAYPDLSDHLLDIADHIVDLIEPFRKKMVYLPEMNGSFSIKQVLPALQPDDPALDYKNLSGSVHNGGEAMAIYPKIGQMIESISKQGVQMKEDGSLVLSDSLMKLPDIVAIKNGIDTARKSLLEYCKLDTLAMVKIWERLKQRAQD